MKINTASTWLEIDRSIIRENTRIILNRAGVSLMAVVKGNGYGHGDVEVARAALEGGAKWLGVARLEEAHSLRKAGIKAPILVLGFVHPDRTEEALENNVTLTAFDLQLTREISDKAKSLGTRIQVHVKIDVGMRRLGVFAEEGLLFFQNLSEMAGIEITGMFTHLPRIDDVKHPTNYIQIERFNRLIKELEEAGIDHGIIHASASAGLLYLPEARYDMVRSGINLIGLRSTGDLPQIEGLLPAMTWKTRIVSIKSIPAGEGVGYNHRYYTQKDERIGVIAVGYADGMRRRLGNFAIIGGKKVNIVGGMCMDQCMVNLDDVPEACVGDEVVLIGRQGETAITAEDIAANWNTTNYEVVNGIHARVPRFYTGI